MAKVPGFHTVPEIRLRKILFALGYRFRLNDARLPGKPDIVLAKHRAVIFVNGCFWHWHGCARSRMPSSNVVYWTQKINRNKKRDWQNYLKLRSLKWRVLIVWECALKPSLLLKTGNQIDCWLKGKKSFRKIGTKIVG